MRAEPKDLLDEWGYPTYDLVAEIKEQVSLALHTPIQVNSLLRTPKEQEDFNQLFQRLNLEEAVK